MTEQTGHPQWGAYARGLLAQPGGTFTPPRAGPKHDQAHPPIHPTRGASKEGDFAGDFESWRVYELIARHFLACCSPDATGSQTTVAVDMGGEGFSASGTQVHSRGWYEVYPYQKWHAALLPAEFVVGQRFLPTSVTLHQGDTAPPHLLNESELISLMDQHGIGTDATIPEHIGKVQVRGQIHNG